MADEERRLVVAAQRGDVDSFNALVQMYESRVYNLGYRMLGDPDSAADATQEAFFSAYRNLRSFRGGSFRSWLLRIATNACYDVLRSRQRKPSTSLDAAFDEGDDAAPLQIADEHETPDEFVLRRELAGAIQDGLQHLAEDQRLVLVLSDIQGLSYEEIAQITDSNLGTVKSRLSRARARLRDVLRAGEHLPLRYRHDTERSGSAER